MVFKSLANADAVQLVLRKNKLTSIALITAMTVASGVNEVMAQEFCPDGPAPLQFSTSRAFEVEKKQCIPAINTDAFTYNMGMADTFGGDVIYFLDQKNGKIYSYDQSAAEEVAVKKRFDMDTSPIPGGLTLSWPITVGSSAVYKVKAMTKGSDNNEVIVVFNSATLPTGWDKADAKLPVPGAFGKAVCGDGTFIDDIYRVGTVPGCFQNGAGTTTITSYDVFYKYTLDSNGEFTNHTPFFASEVHVNPGHLGGGIVTLPDNTILWSPGDCTFFGIDGHLAPQLDDEWCGKIIRIDPSDINRSYNIVAKGVRNSQQMRLHIHDDTSYVSFTDIGGVTAEEINSIPLDDLLNVEVIENFGWGRNIADGLAREGTFYVSKGKGGILGNQPWKEACAKIPEEGFIQPWIQFGRTATDTFYGISSLALPSVGDVRLMWTEFNTGVVMGTEKAYEQGVSPALSYKYKLYDTEGNELVDNLNDLVKRELGDVGYFRGDARLFTYPDGQAGAFIERTGCFYALKEIAAPVVPVPEPAGYECPHVVFSEDAPNKSTLAKWQPTDYDDTKGLLTQAGAGSFLDHGFMYNSPMVLPPGENKKLFGEDYKLTNSRTTFPSDGSSPGVPGAFSYNEGYELWGGDEVKLGKHRYSSMIGHLFHSHILTVIAKINVLRRSPCEETISQDSMLEHLVDGSKQIFARFAGLIDSDGNNILPSENPLTTQLFDLMSMLIYGDDTEDGEIKLDQLNLVLGTFLNVASTTNNPNMEHLMREGGRIQAYLTDVLHCGCNDIPSIPLMAWKNVMQEHSQLTGLSFLRYREAWRTNSSHPEYAFIVGRANAEHKALINTGPQMAAFFGLLYSITNFLDKFYYTSNDEDYSIPLLTMDTNVNYVHSLLKSLWMEKVVMFNDYTKAAVLDDEEELFKIQVNLLDSSTRLTTAIGEIFYRLDTLIRHRNVFGFLNNFDESNPNLYTLSLSPSSSPSSPPSSSPISSPTTTTTTNVPKYKGSNNWYVDWKTESCVKDCDKNDGGPCKGPPEKIAPYNTAQQCCQLALSWVGTSCVSKSNLG